MPTSAGLNDSNAGGLSEEALAFLRSYPSDGPQLDLEHVVAYREAARQGYQPAIDRAIDRHELDLDDITVDGVECLRVRSRSGGTANGTMLYLFGGGFVVGDPETDLVVSGHLAERGGFEVVCPRYRLAPEHPFPNGFQDCWAAYGALVASVGPVALAGESAGGNLALLVAQAATKTKITSPKALALLSPASDLRLDENLFAPTNGHDPTLNLDGMQTYMEAYLSGMDPADPAVSPAFGSMSGLPPTMMTTGSRDQLMPMVIRLDRAMRRAGVHVETRVWDGLWHVFEYYDDYPESAESLDELADFLRLHA